MNMTLSKRGDYVMRSAIALARAFESGKPRKIREVVAETEVPRTFASQVLADLVRANVAMSKAGRDGGYWLARPPADISILEVIEAAEGPLRAERCALGDGPCRWDQVCPLHATWSAATAGLRELLSASSLAEVAARDAAIEAGTYGVPEDSHRTHAVAVEIADTLQVELPDDVVCAALSKLAIRLASLLDQSVAGTTVPAGNAVPAAESPVPGAECSLGSLRRLRGATEAVRYLLVWRIPGADASHFEGELSVASLDADRSELRLAGSWHAEAAGTGPLTTTELEQRARRVVRGFLRRLARLLEEPTVVQDPTVKPEPPAFPGGGTTRAPARRRSRQRTS